MEKCGEKKDKMRKRKNEEERNNYWNENKVREIEK